MQIGQVMIPRAALSGLTAARAANRAAASARAPPAGAPAPAAAAAKLRPPTSGAGATFEDAGAAAAGGAFADNVLSGVAAVKSALARAKGQLINAALQKAPPPGAHRSLRLA